MVGSNQERSLSAIKGLSGLIIYHDVAQHVIVVANHVIAVANSRGRCCRPPKRNMAT